MQSVHLNCGEKYKYLCSNSLIFDTILKDLIQCKPTYTFVSMYLDLLMIHSIYFYFAESRPALQTEQERGKVLESLRFSAGGVRDFFSIDVRNEVRSLEKKREVV